MPTNNNSKEMKLTAVVAAERRKKQLDKLMEWVENRLSLGDVPRFQDVVDYAHMEKGFKNLSRHYIVQRLRLHPTYQMSSRQQRPRHRAGKNRPIIVKSAGNLHCDLGFFARKREYETPVTYRAGFLVAKDILTRFIYVTTLNKAKSARALISAFKIVMEKFGKQNDGKNVEHVSFDQEPAIMGHQFQEFLREHFIRFHPFQYTSSKSKLAENGIRLLRTMIARLQTLPKFEHKRWWSLLQVAADALNSQKIVVKGKKLSYAPADINASNLQDFMRELKRADPMAEFSQYEIAPQFVQFAFQVGDVVRPKSIVTSSAAIGQKRSEVSLDAERFVVERRVAYVNSRGTVGQVYVCTNLSDGHRENFDQSDIALSV